MFCPNCKSEYRPGFTHCVDCDVDLVDSLEGASGSGSTGAAAEVQRDGDDAEGLEAPQLLWSGIDNGAFSGIRAALDDADIPYNDETLEVRLLYASMRNPLEIWVQRGDYEAARKVVAAALGRNPEDIEFGGLPEELAEGPERFGRQRTNEESGRARLTASDSSVRTARRDDRPLREAEEWEAPDAGDGADDVDTLENFNPEDATVEVWSGTDAAMGQMLKDCLREHRIGASLKPGKAPQWRLLIYPVNERQAQEIVRQVVEGVPPE
jgi:hypothetical protein